MLSKLQDIAYAELSQGHLLPTNKVKPCFMGRALAHTGASMGHKHCEPVNMMAYLTSSKHEHILSHLQGWARCCLVEGYTKYAMLDGARSCSL